MSKNNSIGRIGKVINKVLCVIGFMWLIFIIDLILPINLVQYGIVPRTVKGLIGLCTSPFLHGGVAHIISNSIGLIGLLTLSFSISSLLTPLVLFSITVIGGFGVWVFGSNGVHVGASLWVYGLIGYLLSTGLFRRNFLLIAISGITFLVYGGVLFGLFRIIPGVSFSAHLFGFIAGIITAALFKNKPLYGDEK